ncbi:MAG: hypothetical protein K0U21_06905 [Proteobacteria bacterium]|nr:hypothetical protein [Pseudomonadota bacterium]
MKLLIFFIGMTMLLSACGKKGNLLPPPETKTDSEQIQPAQNKQQG